MRRLRIGLFVLAVGCSTSAAVEPTNEPTEPSTSGKVTEPKDAGAPSDTTTPTGNDAGADAGSPDAGYALTYRSSLGKCWTEQTCNRALTLGHGGDWSYTGAPYLSTAALDAAYAHGADGVKIDGRITKDGVVVLSHSSPIETFESLDCNGKKIEEMTAAEVTQCHRLSLSSSVTNETFQRLDTVIEMLRGKLVIQVCVKLSTDLPGIAAAVLALHAEDFVFLEISTSDLQTIVPTIPDHDKLWYLINIEDRMGEVDTLLDTIKNPRAFMYEFDSDVSIAGAVATRIHDAGLRTFTYNKDTVSSAQIKSFYDAGYDVVSTNDVGKAVAARIEENTARSVSPP